MHRTGDILTARASTQSPALTAGRRYPITSDNAPDALFTILTVSDDNGEPWLFFAQKPDDEYHYANFFYTKSETRDMRISELLS